MAFRESRIFKWWERYEHQLGMGALAVGFLFDLIVADRPDSIGNNLLLLAYLVAAGAVIILLNRREMRRKERQHSTEPFFLLLLLQFCFGGLASNLLVLYGRSGTLAVNALFLGLLAALLFGNEFLRSKGEAPCKASTSRSRSGCRTPNTATGSQPYSTGAT